LEVLVKGSIQELIALTVSQAKRIFSTVFFGIAKKEHNPEQDPTLYVGF
jgi:hypothetical protein